MAAQQNLVRDEEQRIREHESVKDDVRRQVHADIARDAHGTPADRAAEADAADHLKERAITEVRDTEHELARGRSVARGSQFIDYAFYLVYGIIAVAIVLSAIGASQSAGFTRFIEALASPFVAPFRGILHDESVGRYRFMLSYVVALGVYLLLHLAINGLLRIFTERKTAV
ncbi:MAG TPA: hypothetical protein VFV78_08660 [Vicinamibacterales bacterium]|nr:hypothetical protein [Vicinamibacterales bacterium]